MGKTTDAPCDQAHDQVNDPITDPSGEATLSAEIRSLLGVYGLYTQVLAEIEEIQFDDGLPDAARKLLIRMEHPLRMGDLAKLTNLLPSTVTALVDSLETADLVARNRDPSDRRAWILSLTPKGEAHRAELVRTAGELFQRVTGFDQTETETFARLTDKARKNIVETLLDRSRPC